jgi:type IV secretory pathway VirB2 component (pilin)
MIFQFAIRMRSGFPHWQYPRRLNQYLTLVALLVLFPVFAIAQSGGTPFDTGFTALQNLFTGTIAKVASLIAIVVGGYQFAHGEPGAKKPSAS